MALEGTGMVVVDVVVVYRDTESCCVLKLKHVGFCSFIASVYQNKHMSPIHRPRQEGGGGHWRRVTGPSVGVMDRRRPLHVPPLSQITSLPSLTLTHPRSPLPTLALLHSLTPPTIFRNLSLQLLT
ncbi:hypothetical protein E2C01_037643 [Portunus trituberculatus]|uniref:Uncharacterized protein n=1 Tax=Portunus trituberculatus TaxID=210409 RepID=A0A5B7FHK6_PORTR|nr:hypothetical protein [Portunus trituberculatus]